MQQVLGAAEVSLQVVEVRYREAYKENDHEEDKEGQAVLRVAESLGRSDPPEDRGHQRQEEDNEISNRYPEDLFIQNPSPDPYHLAASVRESLKPQNLISPFNA